MPRIPVVPGRHLTLGDVIRSLDFADLEASGNWGHDERARVVGPDTIRVVYPRGSASPSTTRIHGAPAGGAQAYVRLKEPCAGARLTYEVRFPETFDPRRGGKLPGLYGRNPGAPRPSGGKSAAGAFSARLMWRAGLAGEIYLYSDRNRGAPRGESIGRGGVRFRRGVWHAVTLEVVLGPEGRVLCDVDGARIGFEGGPLCEGVRVGGLFFSTFFGGTDPSWACAADTHVDFRRFAITPLVSATGTNSTGANATTAVRAPGPHPPRSP